MRKLFAAVAVPVIVTALLALLFAELYREGRVRINYPSRTRFPVWGIDVSHHQGPVDWPGIHDAGVQFAFIKASEGGDFRDPRFPENWREARSAGVRAGAYHFFTFCTEGVAQAENFLAAAPPTAGTLPPAADVEFSGNCRSWTSIGDIRRELVVFLQELERAHGRRPILYLTRKSYERIVADEGSLDGYDLWFRSLVGQPSLHEPDRWTFWQYADNGRIGGITGLVDLNVYRAGGDEFARLLAP